VPKIAEQEHQPPLTVQPIKDEHGFPTLGVALAGVVVIVAITREFVLNGSKIPLPALAPVLLVGVLGDILLLNTFSARMEVARWSFARSFLTTLALNLMLGLAYLFGICTLGVALGITAARTVSNLTLLRAGVMWSLQIFALWALGFQYPRVARDASLRSQESARLREQAELAQLRAHLQPHFLRNTLNAIAALITEDPRASRRLLATLGDLLSDSLESAAPTHTLQEEMAWLKRYAEILTTRHHGTLSFRWDIPTSLEATRLPTLLLQPLVENAVLHGALNHDGHGEVVITAKHCNDGGVELIVADNGPGLPDESLRREGLGLRLVRRRLELECPRMEFDLASSTSGTRAVVRLW